MEIRIVTENGSAVTVQAQAGETLLALARQAGLTPDAPCDGRGSCGKCLCRLLEGTVEEAPQPQLAEALYRQGWRLACRCRVSGGCTVYFPAQGVLATAKADFAALTQRLKQWQLWKDLPGEGIGCALDIGTTTVCAVLCDLADGRILGARSCANAQLTFGADVIHRIMHQQQPGGVRQLRSAVTEQTLKPLIEDLCRQAGIGVTSVSAYSVAANTTMAYLLMGYDAAPIPMEQFRQQPGLWENITAAAAGLPGKPAAPVHFCPHVGAFVGGDISAGVLASGLWQREGMQLFVDLGTNGELVLGNREFMLCCACSAGPAFEGGEISCGMRAADGAVEAVDLTRDRQLQYRIIGGGKPAGICGSGLVDLTAQLLRLGIIDAGGRLDPENPAVFRDEMGITCFSLFSPEQTAHGRALFLSQTDLDHLIRAKAAVFAGIDTMLRELDLQPQQLEGLYIAGGIGQNLDLANAIQIGLLPPLPPERCHYVGNTALAGAWAALLSEKAIQACADAAQRMTYLDLAMCPGYMDDFIAASFLPHTRKERFVLPQPD